MCLLMTAVSSIVLAWVKLVKPCLKDDRDYIISDGLSILAALCKFKFGGPRPPRISINVDL